MPDIFISYSRADKPFVEQLYQELSQAGWDVWVDWEDILPSSIWLDDIYRNIEAVATLIFVLSPNSLSSPVCNLELAYARSCQKRIIPIVLQPTDEKLAFATIAATPLDDFLLQALAGRDLLLVARDNWLTIRPISWIFFDKVETFAQQFQALQTALKIDWAYLQTHASLFNRAREWQHAPKNRSLLLTGDSLQTAIKWFNASQQQTPPPTNLHQSYIQASRSRRDKQRFLTGSVVLVALTAFVIIAAATLDQQTALQTTQAQRIAIQQTIDSVTATMGFSLQQAGLLENELGAIQATLVAFQATATVVLLQPTAITAANTLEAPLPEATAAPVSTQPTAVAAVITPATPMPEATAEATALVYGGGFSTSAERVMTLIARKSDLESQMSSINTTRELLGTIMDSLWLQAANMADASAIQARLDAIQQLDKALEMQANRINMQYQALTTELESIKRAIERPIEGPGGFKTLG